MRIGFIGTGTIASALVRGLCIAEPSPERVLVSPRNAEKAAALARAFEQVEVAPDNQAVVDGSDWVFLALRPPAAREVIGGLRFRAGQRIVSVMASVPEAPLRALVAPATHAVRAVPLPCIAKHIGPTALYPADAEATALFDRLGGAIPLTDEATYHAVCVVTAFAAAQYALLDRLAEWLAGQGMETAAARRYVAGFSQAVAADAGEAEHDGFAALIDDVATPGGMNEQVLRMFDEAGWLSALEPACRAILERHRKLP
jgi:pyrroline-5-carboxylate reductase